MDLFTVHLYFRTFSPKIPTESLPVISLCCTSAEFSVIFSAKRCHQNVHINLKVNCRCLALCCCSRLSSVLSSMRLREMPALERDDTVLDKVLDLVVRHVIYPLI